MTQSIFERQKEDKFINLHLAKDRFYIQSEIFWKVGFWGSLIYGITMLAVYFSGFDFFTQPVEIIVGAGSLLFAGIFKKWSEKKKRQGARTQEEIDTTLFQIPWNNSLVPEREVNPDLISLAAPKSKKDPARFRTWYSLGTSAKNSHNVQILKCQRENISFDYLLRQKFTSRLFWVGTGVIIFILGSLLVMQKTGAEWFSNTVLPLSGFFAFVAASWYDNSQTIKDHEKMEQAIRIKLQKLSQKPDAIDKADLREVQDTIFRTRAGKTIIPNSFYEKHRTELDNLIIRGTNILNEKNI